MSSFGTLFKITTFGESHCNSVGVIIENTPSNLELNENDLIKQLQRRRPGQSIINTERNEQDIPIILSGTENNITLGTPICVIVKNKDTRPEDYQFNKEKYIFRPSHADFTYWQKYGIHASSGGGRSSARETIARVIGGSIAEKYLKINYNIEIIAFVSSVSNIKFNYDYDFLLNINRNMVDKNIIRCPDNIVADNMINYIKKIKSLGDSCGGIVTCICKNVPIGLGEPCFDKFEALLAQAMLSIPSTKGFEIGSGFDGTKMLGSKHNDIFINNSNINTSTDIKNIKNMGGTKSPRTPPVSLKTKTNYSGGIQGGISNGEPIYFNVAFKPPSTIKKKQSSVDFNGNNTILNCKGRHDPCVVNRAVPIVESMAALVIMDLLLRQKSRIC